jgi:hypothetical protein
MILRHLALAMVLVLPAPLAHTQEPDNRRVAATYVFLGTVAAPQAGSIVRPEGGLVVVVNEIYLQKGTFEDQTGRQVEVLGAPARLQERAQYVFYTEPLRFGQTIAVRFIDATEAGGAAQQTARMKQDVSEAYTRREIQERAALAELVVSGTVTRLSAIAQAPSGESEHLPDFRVARIKVEQALKGTVAGGEVEFIFAASRDVQWYRAPKFQVGDRGVFFLQRAGQEVARMGVERQRFTVLHPLDYRPQRELALVEAALKGVRQ